jgi:protocatechuate 3,4-dioxygenase beta subunit
MAPVQPIRTEVVVVVDERSLLARRAVDAIRAHLDVTLAPGSWTLTVCDETVPGTAGTASSADVVAFVHLTGGRAREVLDPDVLARRVAPLVAHASPRVASPAASSGPSPARLTRRQTVLGLGGLGLSGLLAACTGGGSTASDTSGTTAAPTAAATAADTTAATPADTTATTPADTTAATAATSCELTPETTEGPYYLDLGMVRRDITEGAAGAPLPLTLTVLDTASCAPVEGAAVDIWHCDALGAYSGFAAGGGGEGTTFLRGTQITDAAGAVTFDTIYPGWYRGRTVHIHMKVHVSGRTVLTGQLFFDDATTDAVHATEPYAQRADRDTRNADDQIFRGGGDRSTLAITPAGSTYPAAMTLGVPPA